MSTLALPRHPATGRARRWLSTETKAIGLGLSAAAIAFSRAVQLIGPARAAVFPALVPAVAIVLGMPVTGEIPTVLQLAGLAIVSLGLLFALGIIRLGSRSPATPAR